LKIKIIDTETSDFKGHILEVATTEIDSKASCIGFNEDLVRPPDNTIISWEAMAVHHIRPHILEDKPMYSEIQDKYNDADIYIAHNKGFDRKVLEYEDQTFKGKRWLCTLALSRIAYPEAPSHKLSVLFEYLELWKGFNYEGRAHTALYDTQMTYALLLHIMKTLEVGDIEELFTVSPKVDTMKCTFGKHRGKTWEWVLENDLNYCRWIVDNALKKGNEQVIREWLTEKIN
jgi:exodeoxyribonuclease X